MVTIRTRSSLNGAGRSAEHSARDARRKAARDARRKAETGTGWYAWLARGGLVAKGVSFGIVAALAIGLAVGSGGTTTSRQGALETLARHTWGKALLVLLALGFAGYAIWRFVQAFAQRGQNDEKGKAKKWGKRAGYVGRGLIYAGLTVTTVKILAGSGRQQSQNEKAHKTTAAVLDWPGGRWIVAIVGLCILGAALWNLYRGIARKFEDRWRAGEMSKTERKWGGRAGVAGPPGAGCRVRPDRRLCHQGRSRLRPEKCDWPRRRIAEARSRELRSVAPRADRRRSALLRPLLPRGREIPRRIRRQWHEGRQRRAAHS
jgi:hypothetical protein